MKARQLSLIALYIYKSINVQYFVEFDPLLWVYSEQFLVLALIPGLNLKDIIYLIKSALPIISNLFSRLGL